MFKDTTRACIKTVSLYRKELTKCFNKSYRWYILYNENFKELLNKIYYLLSKKIKNVKFRIPCFILTQDFDNDLLELNVPFLYGYAFVGVKYPLSLENMDILKDIENYLLLKDSKIIEMNCKEVDNMNRLISAMLKQKCKCAQEYKNFKKGDIITISQGPFKGINGTIIKTTKLFYYIKYKCNNKSYITKILKEGVM